MDSTTLISDTSFSLTPERSSAAGENHLANHSCALTPPYTCKFGMVVFLISEALLFAGLIGGYIVLRLSSVSWPPSPDLPVLPKLMTGCNTLFLIGSSLTFHMVEVSVKSGKKGRKWLFATIVLGTCFLFGQGFEWTHLYQEGLWFNKGGIYGSSFFLMTGFHGLHVLIGVLLITWCFLRQVFTGAFTKERHVALDNVGLYWHFVDFVWIFLYSILYLV